jgi:hypothetical protein
MNQNPDIHVTPTSAFSEILWRSYSIWDDPLYAEREFGTDEMQGHRVPFLQGVTKMHYSLLTDRPIVVDKSRSWQNTVNIEMYTHLFGERPKVIVTVRSIDEIVASFVRVFKPEERGMSIEEMLEGTMLVDPLMYLKALLESEYASCVHLVEYDDLVDNTTETLTGIYEFIGVPNFRHSDEVTAAAPEGDFNIDGLHELMPEVRRREYSTSDYLTPAQINKYKNDNFWRY